MRGRAEPSGISQIAADGVNVIARRQNHSPVTTRNLALLAILLAATALSDALGQYRGGRQDAPRGRRPIGDEELPREFKARLWYGAGGTLNFFSFNGNSSATIGLVPQVGYKINPWLSAGPRAGVTWSTVKGFTDLGDRQRANMWDFTAGGFARAKIFMFYAQTEVSYLSNEFVLTDAFNTVLITEPSTGQPATVRDPDTQWLIGAGYNPGGGRGGLGTDIGIFYNLFDDVQSNTSPITFRIMLTYNY